MPPKPDFQEAVEKFISGGESSEELPLRVLPFALSAVQIDDGHNTPVLAVPPPGLGKMLMPIQMAGVMSPGNTPYSGGSSVYIGHGTDFAPNSEDALSINVLNATEETTFIAKDPSREIKRPRAEMENKGLYLRTNSDPPANPDTGPIVLHELAAGGSGWEVGDTFAINGWSADAGGEVDTVDGGGAILTYHLTNNGTAYSLGVHSISQTFDVGGIGAEIEVTEVDPPPPGDGAIAGAVAYAIVNLP